MEGGAIANFTSDVPFRPFTFTMAAVQRPLKGSRISTFYPVKNLPALSTLDSAFQLQEFISLTIRANIHDVSAIVSIPESRSNTEGGSDESTSVFTDEPDGERDARNEFAVDEACWIYEQLRYVVLHASTNSLELTHISSRRLAQDLSHPLITMLQQECTRASCPEMKAGEWMYLCVAHGNDGAMEVSLIFCIYKSSSNTDGRSSNAAPSTTFCIPWTARRRFSTHLERSLHGTRHQHPPFLLAYSDLSSGSTSLNPLIGTLARLPAASGVSLPTLTSITVKSSNRPRLNHHSMLVSSH